VWDVLEDQEAVDLVREHMSSGGGDGSRGGGTPTPTAKAKTAAQLVVEASLSKGSSDNVTVLVVFL